MSTYTLFGKEVTFSKAADRYFYILKAFESAVDGASSEFKSFYSNAGNISNVLDGYMEAVYSITKDWAIDQLYATLKRAEIYDVSEETFEEACWDLESAEPYYDCIANKYNEIVGDLSAAKQYRAMRKSARGRYGWRASTDWGDITTAAITSGTLNAMSGIGHSIVNGIGNLGSSISAAASKRSLYNDEKTIKILDEGVRECVKNIYLLYMDFVNEYKENEGEEIWYDGSPYDSEKAGVLLKNSGEVEGKEKELLFRAFSVCPYHYNVSAVIFLKYEEERKNIFQIAKKYKNDLTPELKWVIKFMYTEAAQKSEEKAQEAKAKIKDFMKEYGITEDETLDQIEYDCLVRLCNPYKSSIPGENQPLLDAIVAYDATDDNKSVVIEEFKIWELAEQYNVEFDDEEKEQIVATFIERSKSKKKLDQQTILAKVIIIMDGLDIEESESRDDFEYEIIDEFASKYDKLPVGGADSILQQVVSCFVSDSAKSNYIYDNDIWELAKDYDVEFSDDEKAMIVNNAFKRMMAVKDADENDVVTKLTAILQALDVMDDSGEIAAEKREMLFKLLSGIDEAKNNYESSVKKSSSGMASNINDDVEAIISDTGITFMTTSLTYRGDQVRADAKKLKYCTIADDEHPFIIYDAHPIMNAYAYGFCLTDKRLVAKQEGSRFEVEIENIISFEKKGFLSSKILVHTRTGTKELEADNLSELQKFADCLNRVVKALPDLKRKSQEKGGEFYKNYISCCVSCVEQNAFLIGYFSADAIVSAIYDEQERCSLDESKTKSVSQHTTNDVRECTVITEKPATYMLPNKAFSEPSHVAVTANQEKKLAGPKIDVPTNEISEATAPRAALKSLVASIDKTTSLNQQLAALLGAYGNVVAARTLLPGTVAFEKKIGKAIAAYAPLGPAERPLLMEDFTIFGSAKEGFVWTNERVYIKDMLEPKVSFAIGEVNDVRYTEQNKALFYIELVTTSKAYKISMRSTAIEAKKTAEFYSDVLCLVQGAKATSIENMTTMQNAVEKTSGERQWLCKCGKTNAGKFCPDCGTSRECGVALWTCVCGTINRGKFCEQCGTAKKENPQ